MKLVLYNLTYHDCPVEIPRARALLEEFVGLFSRWYDSFDLVPLIPTLTQGGGEPTAEQPEVVDLVNKTFFLHDKGNA
ncbi:MAG: hypothetical protein JSW27_25270 [Phycisphaerales bacterium]|nr:MAG: hypothetical protein JSW27_25270 [Phycisphaerales bacterium]